STGPRNARGADGETGSAHAPICNRLGEARPTESRHRIPGRSRVRLPEGCSRRRGFRGEGRWRAREREEKHTERRALREPGPGSVDQPWRNCAIFARGAMSTRAARKPEEFKGKPRGESITRFPRQACMLDWGSSAGVCGSPKDSALVSFPLRDREWAAMCDAIAARNYIHRWPRPGRVTRKTRICYVWAFEMGHH